jgi:cysteine-rich repeat protein
VADECVTPSCGDAIVDEGEACDDGNADNTDACTEACELPACGDGYLQPDAGEDCDDGNLVSGDGCSAYCLDSGGLVWERIWDTENMSGEWPYDVATDAEGNIVVVGKQYFSGSSSLDHSALVVKFDAGGEYLWHENWANPEGDPGDWFLAVAVDSAGDIYAGGEDQGGEADWLTVKYSAEGVWQWEELYEIWTVERAHAALVDSDDFLVMVGHDSSVNGFAGHVRKYAPDGALQWTKSLPDSGVTITEGVVEMANGDYVTLTRGDNPKLRRYSSGGAVIWTVPVAQGVVWEHLAVDGAERLVAAGRGADITVTQYDSSGAELWTRTHDQFGKMDVAWSVAAGVDGSVYVVGFITNVDDQRRAWVRKYDADGNEVWTDLVLGPESHREYTGVTVDAEGAVVVCGVTQIPGNYLSMNLVVRKYAP